MFLIAHRPSNEILTGMVSFFDFIVAANGRALKDVDGTFIELIKEHEDAGSQGTPAHIWQEFWAWSGVKSGKDYNAKCYCYRELADVSVKCDWCGSDATRFARARPWMA